MAFSYTITSTVNYSTVGFASTNPLTEFPAIYGNTDFAYTVNLSQSLGTITSVSVVSSPAYTTETVLDANSIRIVRNPNAVMFSGESYDTVKFTNNNSTKVLENFLPSLANTSGVDTSVFRWNTPSSETTTGTYTFSVTYTDSSTLLPVTTSVSYTQELHWSLTPGLQLLLQLVDRSYY